jgi:hypothetical protein
MQVGNRSSASYLSAVVHVKVSILHNTNICLTIITVIVLLYLTNKTAMYVQRNAVEYTRNVYISSTIVTAWYDFIPFDGDLISPTTIKHT